MELLYVLIFVAAFGVYFFLKGNKNSNNKTQATVSDFEKAKRQRDMMNNIDNIKKELAEQKSGQKNMSVEQVEKFWNEESNN
jgi:hypothetical protein